MRSATHKALERIDYPTQVLMVDFESRFGNGKSPRWPLGFGYQSNIEYICDDNWEFLGCGFGLMGGSTAWHADSESWFVNGPSVGAEVEILRDELESTMTVVVKNAKFDAMILKHHFGIVPEFMIDLDDLLRKYDSRMSHKLKHACEHFKLKAKGETVKFANLRFDEIWDDPMMREALIEYTINDVERQCEILDIVLPIVDFNQHEAFMARHTLNLYLEPRFQVDYKLGRKLEMGMKHQLAKVLKHYGRKMLNSDIQLTKEMGELLAENGETVPLKHCKKNDKGAFPDATKNMVPMLEQYGNLQQADIDGIPLLKARPAFAKDDDGAKWMLAHPDTRVSELMAARIGVKSWPNHINKVRGIMNQARCSGGKLRVPINYHGAHTGRWTGGHGINLLNLGSGGRGRPQHPHIAQVRSMLMSLEGRIMAAPDSGQIEARKLAWLAGQQDLLDQFADDLDPYSVLAEDIFQEKVWKWSDDDVPECAEYSHLSVEEFELLKRNVRLWRGFGKDAILGCGYGMGANKFYQNCLQNPFLRPFFDDGTYTFDTVAGVVGTYRKKYKKITGFWNAVEKKMRASIKCPGQRIRYKVPNSPSEIVFWKKDGTAFIKLPSGRCLRYRNASITRDGKIKWRHGKLWGGTITENIDQASSRDLMTFWIEEMESRDSDIRANLHCYDEVVPDFPKSRAEDLLGVAKEVMLTTPPWAKGMPLSVGGELIERYCK